MTATIQLRDYQQDAHDAVIRQYLGGTRRTLIVLPTGAGKTIVFGSIIAKAIAQGCRSIRRLFHSAGVPRLWLVSARERIKTGDHAVPTSTPASPGVGGMIPPVNPIVPSGDARGARHGPTRLGLGSR